MASITFTAGLSSEPAPGPLSIAPPGMNSNGKEKNISLEPLSPTYLRAHARPESFISIGTATSSTTMESLLSPENRLSHDIPSIQSIGSPANAEQALGSDILPYACHMEILMDEGMVDIQVVNGRPDSIGTAFRHVSKYWLIHS